MMLCASQEEDPIKKPEIFYEIYDKSYEGTGFQT